MVETNTTAGPSAPTTGHRARRRTLVASTIGTVVEWYDLSLYGLAAALVFGPLFFSSSSLGGVLASLGTFAVGFAARPVGGLLLGNLGDRRGRKVVLLVSLLGMGVATVLIGALPTYAQVGVWAPVLLIVLRILQGVAVGGEFAGATLLTAENAPPGRRGFYAAVPAMGTGVGLVLASAVFGLVSLLPDAEFLAWGWRVPFLASIVLVIFGFVVRRTVDETPEFLRMDRDHEAERFPLWASVRERPASLLRAVGVTVSSFVWGYLVQTFALARATAEYGVPRSTMLWAIAVASTLSIVTIPFFGWLSDVVGRRRMVLFGSVFIAVYVFPFFAMLESGSSALVFVAVILALGIGKDSVLGPQAAMIAEMFDVRLRCSGMSASREISGAVFAGTAPVVATALAATGGIPLVGVYVVIACAVTVAAVLTVEETSPGTRHPARHDTRRLER